ncbi:MAG: outer membrane protein assembly factor, partial [Pseudomonas graminis]
MKFPHRYTSGFLLMLSSCAAFADAQLEVRVKPSNAALKSNIEGYVGSLGERDEPALERFSVGAVEQA